MTIATFTNSTGADDAYKVWLGSSWGFSSSSTVFRAGYASSVLAKYGAAFRFPAITIPNNAVVSSVTLNLTAQASNSQANVKARLSCHAADNYTGDLSTVEEFDYCFSTRTATVDWDGIGAWTANSTANATSPDIAVPVAAVINRAGWVSGNALVVFLEDFADRTAHVSNTIRVGHSFNAATAGYRPSLTIEYNTWTEAAPGTAAWADRDPSTATWTVR